MLLLSSPCGRVDILSYARRGKLRVVRRCVDILTYARRVKKTGMERARQYIVICATR